MNKTKKDQLIAQLKKLTPKEQVEICAKLFADEKDNDGQIVLYTNYYPDDENE